MKAVMYHYVRPFDSKLPDLRSLHFDDFKKQLDYFESKYNFVSIEDFKKSLETGVPAKGVLLTFDDGLKCHYDYVFKELKKRGLWGIFYVTSGPIEHSKMIEVHKIHILLASIIPEIVYQKLQELITDKMIDTVNLEEFKVFTYARQINDNYSLAVKRILNYYINYNYRSGIINQLLNILIPNWRDEFSNYYLSESEIKEMHANGMVIGSHTVNHPVMSRLSPNQQKVEIKDSFSYLDSLIANPIFRTFCYPYGGFHSFTDTTEGILKDEKVNFSFNVEQRDINENDLKKRMQALPRYDCNQFNHGQCRPLFNK